MKPVRVAMLVLAIMMCASLAMAQMVAPSKSGLVNYIEGAVYLSDEKVPDPIITQFPYIKENEVLRTEDGRAEILMNPGLTVRLGDHANLRMVMNPFPDTRVELERGSAVVQLTESLKDLSFQLLVKGAVITFEKSGVFHVDFEPVRLRVYAGQAVVRAGGQTAELSSGKMVEVAEGALKVQKFDKEYTEALDRWSVRRGETMAKANASAARNCDSFSFVSNNPCAGTWTWNPAYGMVTYIPYSAIVCDPFSNYCYYSPRGVYEAFYQPPAVTGGGMGSGMPGASMPTAMGSSGAGASSNATMSAPSAGSGSSAASVSSGSSVGQGSTASGSRGR